MNRLEQAILRTILYADVFNYPMTAREITHFLIADFPYCLDDIQAALDQSCHLSRLVETQAGYFYCAGRGELVSIRTAREQASEHLWNQAIQYGVWLGALPFVRMVALTGALAMRNAAHPKDDLDYVLVTSPGRVWLARLFAVMLVRVVKLRGVVLCPNYVLSETALGQNNHSLYIAHELAQMVPIIGQDRYVQMRAANAWVVEAMPNAGAAFYIEACQGPSRAARFGQTLIERALGGALGDALERWEHRRKIKRLIPKLTTTVPHDARLDHEHVKGHFQDHGHPVMQQYYARLRRYNLDDSISSAEMPLAGD
ncbi:MAG: hypothetical protein SF162_17230 [bacterium]|nr:hypothetical protein [bacterium]